MTSRIYFFDSIKIWGGGWIGCKNILFPIWWGCIRNSFIEYFLYIHKHDNVNWMKKDMVDSLVSTHWKIQSEMLLLSKQWTKNTQLCWCELMVVATFKCRVKECFRLWKTFWWTSTEIDGIHELNPVPTNPTKRFTDLVSYPAWREQLYAVGWYLCIVLLMLWDVMVLI